MYVRLVRDMYENSMTLVWCTIGVMDGFQVEVGLHQASALSPFLFAMVMDRLTDEFRRESPQTLTFTDDTVIFGESREQLEGNDETTGGRTGGGRVKELDVLNGRMDRTFWRQS